VFTEEGVTYFIRNGRRLIRFITSDEREEYGIRLVNFSPATVQKLMRLGFVRTIDMPVEDIVPHRRDIMDFSKLITYGMLYMQYDHEVYQDLVKSPLVSRWNRRNAKYSIDHGTRVEPRRLTPLLQKREDAYLELRGRLLAMVEHHLDSVSSLDESERRIARWTAEKFLDALDPLFWFMLLANEGREESEALLSAAGKRLVDYLERASIAEYLALLLIELLMHLHHSTDEEDREESTGFSILWKIRKRKERQGDRGRMHIVLSNHRARYEEVQGTFKDRSSLSADRSLQDFYRDASLSGGESERSLGLYYLSFLSEACRRQGISFESFVNQPASGQALLNLILQFGE
jgi:hypothetical protein